MERKTKFRWLDITGPDGHPARMRTRSEGRPDVPPWTAVPEAKAAAAALAAALREGAPLAGCVEELHYDRFTRGALEVFARRVHASPVDFSRGCSAAALPAFFSQGCESDYPFAVLLTHDFALPPTAAVSARAAQQMQLTTLLMTSSVQTEAEALLAAVFTSGAHVMLRSTDNVFACTDVALDGVCSIDEDAFASWSKQARTALQAALRTQRLAAVAACVERGWHGGFDVLQQNAAAIVPDLGPPLAALATRLEFAFAGGALTRTTLKARICEAEALEAVGRYDEAAALYKQTLADNARHPALRLLGTPPQVWKFYGLALARAGRDKEAYAAYEAGLRALAAGTVEPETPAWRETQRLDLLDSMAVLTQGGRHKDISKSAFERMFACQVEEAILRNDDKIVFEKPPGGRTTMRCIRSGRRWVCAPWSPPDDDHVHARVTLYRIQELPRESGGTIAEAMSAMRAGKQERHDPEAHAANSLNSARRDLLRHADIKLPPKLPTARCAVCGADARKRCAGCGGPYYCGATCQRTHWKAHKSECRRAAQTAAGGDAAEAEA